MPAFAIRAALAASVCAVAIAASPPARFHARLLKSEPMADATVTASPLAIRLWFSERVELGVSSVKVTGPAGAAVKVGPLSYDGTGENAPVKVPLPAQLVSGKYRVNWVVASGDGHPVKGEFAFTVKTGH